MPKPPTYEESLQDVLEGKKQIYTSPDIIRPGDDELPPEYDDDDDDDDEIDYALDEEDRTNTILDDLGIENYESFEKQLNDQVMTPKRTEKCLNKILKDAKLVRNQLKGYKSAVTKQNNSGKISETQKQIKNRRINLANATLNQYIKYYENKAKTTKKF